MARFPAHGPVSGHADHSRVGVGALARSWQMR
jgi:hypothetical protein